MGEMCLEDIGKDGVRQIGIRLHLWSKNHWGELRAVREGGTQRHISPLYLFLCWCAQICISTILTKTLNNGAHTWETVNLLLHASRYPIQFTEASNYLS